MQTTLRLMTRQLALSLALLAGATSALVAGVPPSTLTVCTSGCDHTTIQAAVSASSPGGTVEVNVAGAHIEGTILIEKGVTIRGLGRSTTFIQQAVSLPLADQRVFSVANGARVTIRDLTIRRGRDVGRGCVHNSSGVLLLLDIDIRECDGGALVNNGQATLLGVTIAENEAIQGGGVRNLSGGVLQVGSSSIEGNESSVEGGGLHNQGMASLYLTSIRQNVGGTNGGGIHNSGGTLELESSLVESNAVSTGSSEGGGIYSSGDLTIRTSSVSSNTAVRGAGLFFSGSATIMDSAITGNNASAGGGLFVLAGPVFLTNTTVSGNTATNSGGGIYLTLATEVRLANVTIGDNSADWDSDNTGNGGGIFNDAGTVRLLNSLIVGNFDRSDVFHVRGQDCHGDLTSDGYNLVGTLGSAGIGGNPVCAISGTTIGNTVGVASDLGPLSDNGGPTWTHAPLAGSLAINTGDAGGCFSYTAQPLLADQRGYLRQNRCDRGAFEVGALYRERIFADGFEWGSTLRWSVP